jgi:hypothetical protein
VSGSFGATVIVAALATGAASAVVPMTAMMQAIAAPAPRRDLEVASMHERP